MRAELRSFEVWTKRNETVRNEPILHEPAVSGFRLSKMLPYFFLRFPTCSLFELSTTEFQIFPQEHLVAVGKRSTTVPFHELFAI